MAGSKATTAEEYLAELHGQRRSVISEVRDFVLEHLPDGYMESMRWGMITYEIPLEYYPETYNGQPLSYLSLAAQKNHNALYLMCKYQDNMLFTYLKEFYKKAGKKLNMGKACLRFNTMDELLKEPLAKTISSATPDEFILGYEKNRNKS